MSVQIPGSLSPLSWASKYSTHCDIRRKFGIHCDLHYLIRPLEDSKENIYMNVNSAWIYVLGQYGGWENTKYLQLSVFTKTVFFTYSKTFLEYFVVSFNIVKVFSKNSRVCWRDTLPKIQFPAYTTRMWINRTEPFMAASYR